MKIELSYTKRLSMAAGAASAIAAPVAADAALVTVQSSPISVRAQDFTFQGFGNAATWDVDGVNGPEFALNFFHSITQTPNIYSTFRHDFFYNRLSNALPYGPLLNGLGFVGSTSYARPLPLSARVGATLSAYLPADYAALRGTRVYVSERLYMPPNTQPNTTITTVVAGSGFGGAAGLVNVGFAFTSGANTHYGWATLNLGAGNDNRLTVLEWTYEDTPDTPVHVGTRAAAVPEPASTLPAIAMLALGAAGVRAWRRQKASPNREKHNIMAKE